MMKFIRSRSGHVNAERLKLQKELFEYNQTIFHGFPHRPSALAYDSKLDLIAIGTRCGSLRIYGKPGVEFQTSLKDEKCIDSIYFIENTSQLIVKTDNNAIYLYEIQNDISNEVNNNELILIKSFEYFVNEDETEKVSSKCISKITIHSSHSIIFIGTENGTVHFLNTKNFELSDSLITYENVYLQRPNIKPEIAKLTSTGRSIEVILEFPNNPNKILIGYSASVLVTWNLKTEKIENYFSGIYDLTSACWLDDGIEFVTSHSDGNCSVWNITDKLEISKPKEAKVFYGPFPCRPIKKIYGNSKENILVFSGGIPRNYQTQDVAVSVIKGFRGQKKNNQVLDLTTKIIDFIVINKNDQQSLIILAEEEIVAINLKDPDWLAYKLPYLSSVHSSPITFSQFYSGISDEFMEKLKEIGNKQNENKYTNEKWPIQGGILKEKIFAKENEILITGHESGSVLIWDVSDVSMNLLCSLDTAKLFFPNNDLPEIDAGDSYYDDCEFPPFRKVGVFDPYSDDPRLGIKKIVLSPQTFTILIGGSAGQIIVYELKDETIKMELTCETINIVNDCDGFVWKSYDKLELSTKPIIVKPGFHLKSILQLVPPASITALAIYTDWGLISAGTAHGFTVFNYNLNKPITVKCTLNSIEVNNIGSGSLITRRKSFKKTLRESFRRLRKGRSLRATKKIDKTSPFTSPTKSKSSKTNSKADVSSFDSRPIERQIEAKVEDGIGSVVRCLYFSNAPLINAGQFQRTFWAGTNAGNIFIYLINNTECENENNNKNEIEKNSDKQNTSSNNQELNQDQNGKQQSSLTEKNTEISEKITNEKKFENLTCQLSKEITLKHHAPVIYIEIIDSNGHPLHDQYEINDKPVRVLICSEEQFKLFNLPTLKPYCKFKLTAQEGIKSRRIQICQFRSKNDLSYKEYCIVNINNQGDLGVFSILDLKRQLQSKCTKKEDINGIINLVFTENGEGLFLNSPSEFSRFSLSAQRIIKPNCLISNHNLNKIILKVSTDEKKKELFNFEDSDKKKDEEQKNINENVKNNNELSTVQKDDNSSTINKVTEIEKTENIEIKSLNSKVTEVTKKLQTESLKIEKTIENNNLKKTINQIENEKEIEQINNVIEDDKINNKIVKKVKNKNLVNGVKKNKVSAEVHHDFPNGDVVSNDENKTSTNCFQHNEESKSIEEISSKIEDINEKSNGTPTSGIVDDDDEDSFCDANDLNLCDKENFKNKVIFNNKEDSSNIQEVIIDQINNSVTNDISLDITVDSVKEHFSN